MVEMEVPSEPVAAPVPEEMNGASKEPAKEPEKPKWEVTPASVWKKKGTQAYKIELPSGVTVRVNRPKWAKLITSGMLTPEDVMKADGRDSVSQITAILPTAKRVVASIVAEPRVFMEIPETGEMPDDAILVDDVPEDDIIALFGWAVTIAAPKIHASEA